MNMQVSYLGFEYVSWCSARPDHRVHHIVKQLLATEMEVLRDCEMLVYSAEVSQMSSRLSTESKFYADKAKDLNRQVCNLLH